MWRFWNNIPRVIRNQLHGPRASAGVCVEEETSELDNDKCSANSGLIDCRKLPVEQHELVSCIQSCPNWGTKQEEGERRRANHDQHEWWRYCRGDFWSMFAGPHRALEALTWGAAVVLGLQLSRHHQLQQQYSDVLKNHEKQQKWKSLLFRVAFAMPPDFGVDVGRHILPQDSAKPSVKLKTVFANEVGAPPKKETGSSLEDAMHEFEDLCRQYAAMGNSIKGVHAAEQGNMSTAIRHLQLASQLGHAPAYFNLGLCYEMGYGVEKDSKQAAAFYRLAADCGHAQSIYNLGLMTLQGEGDVVQDKKTAIRLMTKAAQKGLIQAQLFLGVYFTENDEHQQDFEQAASFFRAAADQNDADGQYFLGICYENGWGVPNDEESAAKLYSAAAHNGHDAAMYNLAAFHEYGLGGLSQDIELAMSLYRRSAEAGNESAKFRLSEVHAQEAIKEWNEHQNRLLLSSSTIEQTSEEENKLPNSPTLRRNPISSSPSLTELVRQSLARMWVEIGAPWSSDSSAQVQDPRPIFILGDSENETSECVSSSNTYGTNNSERCMTGLQRTATMPDLHFIACP